MTQRLKTDRAKEVKFQMILRINACYLFFPHTSYKLICEKRAFRLAENVLLQYCFWRRVVTPWSSKHCVTIQDGFRDIHSFLTNYQEIYAITLI